MTGQVCPRGMRSSFMRHRIAVFAALAAAFAGAGCSTGGQPTASIATPRGPTVAFETIDGPPDSIFRKLVQNLTAEAEARQVAVVSRAGPAQYRVRASLATLVEQKRSTIAWVWDVYDASQRRTVRLAGEESAGGAGRTTWAAADDHVLQQIARKGMDQLVAYLSAPNIEPAPNASPPTEEKPGWTIAAAGEVSLR
jgi:hypothetical protein